MSKWNHEPEWLPVDSGGRHWQFVSFRGRYLGCVIRVDTPLEHGTVEVVYVSEKFCCKDMRDHRCIQSAAQRVHSTLFCKDCKLSCLPASN